LTLTIFGFIRDDPRLSASSAFYWRVLLMRPLPQTPIVDPVYSIPI